MSATTDSSAKPPAWRNRKAESEVAPKHRWQTADDQRGPARLPGQSPRRTFTMTVLLLAGLALIAWYVRSLLISPEQTPILVLSAGPYRAPFGPNAWSAEDAEGFAQLHDKTARVTRAGSLQNFDRTLRSLIENQSGAETVVIVLSVHGGVDDESRPCLIPPGASPLNTATWIPLATVLSQIGEAIPDGTNKLVILDCNRVRMRWQQGTLYNAFTNRLIAGKVVEECQVPNLTVFNSVSAGQVGWASADLNATVFGHYLKRALAGEADKPGNGGNGDRSVSLKELRQFVAHHVDQWVQHHRGERQRPFLLRSNTETAEDYHVVWALRGELPAVTPAERAVTDAELDALWDEHDRLRDGAHYAANPRKWADLQRKLLRLEDTAVAGSAYTDQARTLRGEVRQIANELKQSSGSPWAGMNAATANNRQSAGGRVHSLKLAELFGRIESRDARTLRDAWQRFRDNGTAAVLTESLNAAANVSAADGLESRELMRLLRKYNVPQLWGTNNAAGDVFSNRARGTRLAAPADARVFHWLRSQLEAADADQRLLEDRLFAGAKHAPAEYAKQIGNVKTAYAAAQATAADVAAAYALHDRAYAELPWFAYWLSLPGTLMEQKLQDEAVARQLTDVVAATSRFNRALRTQQPYGDPKNRVADALEVLARNYDDECIALGEMKANAGVKALRRIEAALAVPLIPGRQRNDFRETPNTLRRTLRKLRREIAENLRSSYQPVELPESKTAESESDDKRMQDVRNALIRFVARWEDHPAVALLRDEQAAGKTDRPKPNDDSAAPTISRILVAERRLRDRLEAFPDEVKGALASDPVETAAYRGRFSEAARTARAGVAVPLPIVEPDPVQHLRRFEIHRLLLWHAHRSLDDFWAGVDPASRNYYHRAADDYLSAAETVFPATPRKSSTGVRNRITTLNQVARSGLSVNADSDVQLAADEPLMLTARISRSPAFAASVPPKAAVPVFLVDGPEGRVTSSVRPIVFAEKAASSEIRLPLSMTDARRAGAPLNAVALFRGHEFRNPFVANTSGGVVIEWKPQRFGDARITLSGDRRKPVSIVFVLDCSQSMKNATSAGGTQTRMDVAKDALAAMLDQLARRGNARVGVLFYGHRVGWDADAGKEILRRKSYPRKIPEGLLPLEDVETVLSLGRFDSRIAAGVQRLLKRVQPWGETPLYLSIRHGLKQFAGEPSGVEKRIIVITDGENNQRTPDDVTLTKEQQAKVASLSDVTGDLTARKVPVFLLGFELSGADQRAARGEFRAIAAASGGRYVEAVSAKTLLPSLKSLFGSDEFAVTDSSGAKVREAALGKTVSVKVGTLKDGIAALKSGDAELRTRLAGGENLQLRLTPDGRGIRSEPYLVGGPKFVPLIDAATKASTGINAGVHSPTRSAAAGSSVTFAISLQREDGGVAERPAETWVEIVPLNEKGEAVGPVFPFFDKRFDVGSPTPPVPVILCQADGWPKQAVKASVRILVTAKPVAAARRVPLTQLLGDDATSRATFADSELQADVAQVQGKTRLRVVQRAAEKSATLSPLRIGVGKLSVAPERIVRRFDTPNGLAVHEFYFAGDQTKSLLSGELLLTPKSQLETGGRQSRSAVIIGVPAQGAVLRLNGPAR